METPKLPELIKPVFNIAKNIGAFALEQIRGGGWSDLKKEPKPASITVYEAAAPEPQEAELLNKPKPSQGTYGAGFPD